MFYRSIFHHRQFRYLGAFYLHSLIRLFAISVFQIFSSIYIYQNLLKFGVSNQFALGITALFFALIFLVQALSVAPVLWLISKKGLRFSALLGNIFLICFLATLYLSKFDPIFLIITAVLGGLQIALYWIAYHIYLVELSDDKNQGEEIALGNSLSSIASIGGPAFGGLIIYYFGFGALFIIMAITTVVATFPLKFLPARKNIIAIDIVKTVTALSPKREQRSYLAFLGIGVIDVVTWYFWPLFIFPIMAGFAGVGFIGSLIVLVSSVTNIITGWMIDKFGAKKVINILSPLDSLVWVFRIFVTTPLRVFVASTGQALTTTGQVITLDAMVYERARHTDIAAFIVQREIGLSLGRFLFLISVGVLFWFGMPFKFVFIFAAAAALLPRFYPAESLAKDKVKHDGTLLTDIIKNPEEFTKQDTKP
ncbi:MFS transporter [Patescibacteria group bacterium]|nr:MFS transporter [Patescibacteria group bacterium]